MNEERLATALYLVLYEAHQMYGSTATWHGGIGGAMMTVGCAFKDPAPDQIWAEYDLPSKPLREWMDEHPEFDIRTAAEAMKTELIQDLGL